MIGPEKERPETAPANDHTNVPSWGRADALALLAWTAALVWLFGDAALLRRAFYFFDVTEINYPYREFLAREFTAGRFSRWMPGLYCGLPLFSESQAGYLHPSKLLYLVLPAWKAFNLDTILSVWLAGVAAYGWLRRHVGPAGALTGAAIVGIGGYTWAHLVHTSMLNALPSVPLALWALESSLDGGRRRALALGALALAAQVFAGHLQDALMTMLLVGVYGLYLATTSTAWPERRRALGTSVGMVLLAVAIAAVQWIPSKELIDRSPRAGGLSYEEATYGSWHPQLLPTMLVREAYGTRARDTDWMDGFFPYHEMNTYLSLLGLGLAVLGAAAYRDRWAGFWVLLAGVALVLMLGRYTALYDVWYRIPVLGSGRIPVRYHLWLTMAVAALAALGVDRLARGRVASARPAAITLGLLLAACVPILFWTYTPVWSESQRWTLPYHIDRYNWLGRELAVATARTLGLALAGWTLARRAVRAVDPQRRRWLAAGLPLLVLADLALAHATDAPTVDPSYWTEPPASVALLKASPRLQRVFGFSVISAGEPGYASTAIDPFPARDTLAWSLAPVWGIDSATGLTPIIAKRVERYGTAANESGVRFDLESVSHILTGTPSAADRARFANPERAGRAFLIENRTALPRCRLAGRPVYATDERDATMQFQRLKREALVRVVVEDPDRPLAPDATLPADAAARIVSETPEHIAIETSASGPAYLVLADTYDPGWSARLDGTPVPVRPANVAFRAVFLPAGRHRVELAYQPAGFAAGLAATLAGLAAVVVFMAWPGPRRPGPALHAPSPWPARWPLALAIAIVLLLAGSTVAADPAGRPCLQDRWDRSVHPFTWGAGIEAMRPA